LLVPGFLWARLETTTPPTFDLVLLLPENTTGTGELLLTTVFK